jgi:hypothetical protein
MEEIRDLCVSSACTSYVSAVPAQFAITGFIL